MRWVLICLLGYSVAACRALPENIKMPHQSHDGLRDPEQISENSWSNSGVMTTGNADTKVSLQAVFPRAGNYTIEFDLQPVEPFGSNPINAVAEITWSVKGNSVTRRVSVGNGVSISGQGQGVRVVVSDVTGGFGILGKDYNVFIQVAPGTRPAIQQPVTLIGPFITSRFLLGPGGSGSIPIPPNSGVISVNVTAGVIPPVSAGTPIVDQDAQVQQLQGAFIFKIYDPRDTTWVPVAPGATSIKVLNNSAAQAIQFFITFGIDG